MKDNYITYRSSTANRYKEDKEYIVLKKLPKVYETFRNLKLFKNIEQIEEIGYAENRVNAFSDSFYDNPMKAVSYLKSKKALTKKEVDEFLGTQTK